MKDIVFFWIQGSGKGTQAKLLLQAFPELQYLEPGQIFRALNSNENLISTYIAETIQRWELVSDNLIYDLFKLCSHIAQNKAMLMDGFPRSLPQLDFFLQQEEQEGREFIAINFELSKEKAIERIKQRAIEQNRSDDVESAIKKRIESFEKETLPVIQQLQTQGKIISINADQSVDTIFEEVKTLISER